MKRFVSLIAVDAPPRRHRLTITQGAYTGRLGMSTRHIRRVVAQGRACEAHHKFSGGVTSRILAVMLRAREIMILLTLDHTCDGV